MNLLGAYLQARLGNEPSAEAPSDFALMKQKIFDAREGMSPK